MELPLEGTVGRLGTRVDDAAMIKRIVHQCYRDLFDGGEHVARLTAQALYEQLTGEAGRAAIAPLLRDVWMPDAHGQLYAPEPSEQGAADLILDAVIG